MELRSSLSCDVPLAHRVVVDCRGRLRALDVLRRGSNDEEGSSEDGLELHLVYVEGEG